MHTFSHWVKLIQHSGLFAENVNDPKENLPSSLQVLFGVYLCICIYVFIYIYLLYLYYIILCLSSIPSPLKKEPLSFSAGATHQIEIAMYEAWNFAPQRRVSIVTGRIGESRMAPCGEWLNAVWKVTPTHAYRYIPCLKLTKPLNTRLPKKESSLPNTIFEGFC